ncbi:MAG: BREX system Lon protease-like protein BrxL [Thermoproteota archaeon]
MGMDELNAKLKYVFGDVVVRKDLVLYQEVARLPRFISEYLVSSLGKERPERGDLARVADLVSRCYPEPRDRDKVLHDLMKVGEYNVIDEVKVFTDISSGTHRALLWNLGVECAITDELLEKYENLLRQGLWGLVRLQYVPQGGEGRVAVVGFLPFQVAKLDVGAFVEGRRKFTVEEWVDVLISTVGFNPTVLDFRKKLVILSRLIPLVEPNVNMMELGPRNTGKTYTYLNTSHYTRIFSGGRVSPAVLIWNLARNIPGEITTKDCVVFDEISKIEFSSADEMMGKLKLYMESGYVERGDKRGISQCSLMFMGNVDVKGEVPIEDFTYVLPEVMRDPAFIDRIHGFIPGWEVPKIGRLDLYLSKHYGFVTDYFAEILHELRKRTEFYYNISDRVELSNVTGRDEKAIKRLAAGALKLIAPDEGIGGRELKIALDLAVEYRQRVADWLHFMRPGEYERKKIGYKIGG